MNGKNDGPYDEAEPEGNRKQGEEPGPLVAILNRIGHPTYSDEKDYRPRKDKPLQRLLNVFDRHHNVISAGSAIVSLVLTGVLVWATLVIAEANNKLVGAANNQFNAIRQQTAAVSRPWMVIGRPVSSLTEQGETATELRAFALTILWENTGQSAAKIISGVIDYRIVGGDRTLKIEPFVVSATQPFAARIVAPKGSTPFPELRFSDQTGRQLTLRTQRLIIYSRIEYESVLDGEPQSEPYFTEVTMEAYLDFPRRMFGRWHPVVRLVEIGEQQNGS